ncbi:AAA family ATPase [Lentzea sp. NPDC051208]|uniref:AAA family ATPase n=1 Tax=Lentzea sp. NPDC051208 TaxID=3154642 RepID=UPI00342161DA
MRTSFCQRACSTPSNATSCARQSKRTAESTQQHLKRGLLLHGPPGTGKTHTIRYLMGRLESTTVIVLSGVAMFKLLNPALFELLNEMDGVGSEADVTFVLTTNRVDVMEQTLAQRPGPDRPRHARAVARRGGTRTAAAPLRVPHGSRSPGRLGDRGGERGRHGVVREGARAAGDAAPRWTTNPASSASGSTNRRFRSRWLR